MGLNERAAARSKEVQQEVGSNIEGGNKSTCWLVCGSARRGRGRARGGGEGERKQQRARETHQKRRTKRHGIVVEEVKAPVNILISTVLLL